MKLTKDHLIEGQIIPKGTEVRIIEKAQSAEDKKQAKAVMDKFAKGELKDTHGNVVKSKDQATAISHAKSKSDN